MRASLFPQLIASVLLIAWLPPGRAEEPSAAVENASTHTAQQRSGAVHGRLLGPDGAPASGIRVSLSDAQLSATTDDHGRFLFSAVPPGIHQLAASGTGFRSLRMTGLLVASGRTLTVETQSLQAADEAVTRLDPFVVEGRQQRLGAVARGEALLIPRTAGGNLDLPRTQDGALPYHIYNREQIERSGVVNLNAFLQRELLDSDAATRPP